MERVAHGRLCYVIFGRLNFRALVVREMREPCFQEIVKTEQARIVTHKLGSAASGLSPLSFGEGRAQGNAVASMPSVVLLLAAK